MKYCSLAFDELKIDRTRLARQMGYADGGLPLELGIVVDEILDEAAPLCDIRFAFVNVKEFTFDHDGTLLILADGSCFSLGKVIFSHLCQAKELLFFICTAGSAVTKWAAQLSAAGDALSSYVVDALGGVMAEATAEILHRRLRGRMAVDHREVSNRYSPGYCGWPVADQAQLFRQFPENICGVTLSPAGLMEPIKSISGVIGVGEDVVYTPYSGTSLQPESDPQHT